MNKTPKVSQEDCKHCGSMQSGICWPNCTDVAADNHPKRKHAGIVGESCNRCIPWSG